MVSGTVTLANADVPTTSKTASRPFLLAHRGVAQTFGFEGMTNDTCTASRIHQPEHPYLENTLPSMRAAFAAEADMVEFDIQLTADGQFAVFHDAALECRTNGNGAVRSHTLAELRRLDVGYGYTADGGKTYPFRGKGIGLLPSLDEVLDEFAGKRLLVHVKSNEAGDGHKLAERLAELPFGQRSRLTVYGGDKPVAAIAERLPGFRVFSRAIAESCVAEYTRAHQEFPKVCENRQLHIPEPYLTKLPRRFFEELAKHDTRVILVAGDGEFSEGFDSAESLRRTPSWYTGGIWTNRIDVIGPLVRR